MRLVERLGLGGSGRIERVLGEGLSPGSSGRDPVSYGSEGVEKRLPVVWACVSLIVQRLQSLPVRVVDSAGRQVPNMPVWLRGRGEWTWDDLLSAVVWSLLLRGNAFLRPTRARGGQVGFVGAVHPDAVSYEDYGLKLEDGLPDKPTIRINGQKVSDLVHARWVTEPGCWWGLTPVDAARRALYTSEASIDSVARHFSQGARLQYVLTAPGEIGLAAKKEAMALIRSEWSGTQNWWRPLILDGGMKVDAMSMTARDGEFLGLSQWSDARIAGQIFHIDPTLVGLAPQGASLTYSNAVDRESNLWRDALRPAAHKVEMLFSALLPLGQRLELDESGLLTGSPRDRLDQAQIMTAINQAAPGTFSVEEVRRRAGFPVVS